MPDRRLTYARGAAIAQGVVWFLWGSFGGWGLLAGPMAWLAAAVSGRFRLVARTMLLLLGGSWVWSWLFSAPSAERTLGGWR